MIRAALRGTLTVAALALASNGAAAGDPGIGELKAKAEAGDAAAQVKLGEALYSGRGIVRDPAVAAEWFRKAADQGASQGLAALGMLTLTGSGVVADSVKAAELMRQAADKGSVPASYNLGLMALRGQGMAPDRAQAMAWLRKAADAKYPDAQYALGLLNVSPDARPQDGVEAVKWLSLAATHGNAELRGKALAKIKVISDAIGSERTQEGLEAARVWFYSHS